MAQQLQAASYRTEVRESETSWLLRAEHDLPESQDVLESVAQSLTELAVAEGGEYDGWERGTDSAPSGPIS